MSPGTIQRIFRDHFAEVDATHPLDQRAVWAAWNQGKPNQLATYLYELAAKYHRFYQACPVLKAETATLVLSRLNVSAVVRKVLATGLGLLGIDAPERM